MRELKGDRPQFIRPDLFIHPGRVHVRAVGPGHGAEIQAGLIETGLVLERFEDATFRGRQKRREIRDALRVIHEGDGETVIGPHRKCLDPPGGGRDHSSGLIRFGCCLD